MPNLNLNLIYGTVLFAKWKILLFVTSLLPWISNLTETEALQIPKIAKILKEFRLRDELKTNSLDYPSQKMLTPIHEIKPSRTLMEV